MPPLSMSFIGSVTQSLLDHLDTDCGVDSVLYPAPEYMLVKKFGRAGGNPQLIPPDKETPAVWLEYIAGADAEAALGRDHFGMLEEYNLYGYSVYTPEVIEMADRDADDFRRYVEIAGDALMRRLMLSITGWSDSITDGLVGGTTNGAVVTTWATVLTARNVLEIEARIMLRLQVNVE